MSYFLTSTRLRFRRWTTEDEPLASALWGDSRITGLIGGPFSAEHVRQRLRREIATEMASGVQYWPMFLLSTNAFVGCCGLRPYRPEEGILELGFHLAYSSWGQGLAAEAARAVILHAFDTLDVHGLFAGHHPNNAASARLLQRLGFRYTHHEHYGPTGLQHPSYRLMADEFVR